MKKLFLLPIASLVYMTTLSAQISQEQADGIVIERLSNETKPYCVYAKEDVQTNFEVTTATDETLELSYPAWVYYVSYSGETSGKYLIVKENNGNLLEINTKNDEGPDDLENWRIVVEDEYPIEIPFEEYSLEGTFCKWINLNYPLEDGELIIINSAEELINYVSCTEGSYPKIDFSQYTLLLASGYTYSCPVEVIVKDFLLLTPFEYQLDINVFSGAYQALTKWVIALVVNKLKGGSVVELNVTYM